VLNHRWQWEQKDIYRAIGGFRDAGFATAAQLVNYTASHDEVRPEHEIKFYSARHIARPPGWSVEKVALALARCGLVTLFAAPGVPMLYAGQEYGDDSPRTIDFVPLQWHKLTQPAGAEQHKLVQRLIRTRQRHPALRGDHIEFVGNDFAHQHVVRFRRWDDARGDYVVVAVNFGHEPRAVDLPVAHPGRWRDVVGNRVRTAVHGSVSITLGPYDAAMFVASSARG
jgi:1,4-alpha-glucan branching enzyme